MFWAIPLILLGLALLYAGLLSEQARLERHLRRREREVDRMLEGMEGKE